MTSIKIFRLGDAAGGVVRGPTPLQGVVISIHGRVKNSTKKQIAILGDDEKLWKLRRTSKTKFYRGDKLAVGAAPKEKKVLTERPAVP